MRKLLLAGSALLISGAIALAANSLTVPFLSGPGPQEPSQTNSTINSVIQNIYTGVNGLIASQPGPVSSTATNVAQTFATTTIPTSTLNVPGQALHARCWGITGPGTANKAVALNFGTATVMTGGSMQVAGSQWWLDLYVQAVTATANFVSLGRGGFGTTNFGVLAKQVTADNLQTGLTMSCTGQDNAVESGGIQMQGFMVEQVK